MSVEFPDLDAGKDFFFSLPSPIPFNNKLAQPPNDKQVQPEDKKNLGGLFQNQVKSGDSPSSGLEIQVAPGTVQDADNISGIGVQVLIGKEIPHPADPHASLARALELSTPLSEAQLASYSQRLDSAVRVLSEFGNPEKAERLSTAKDRVLQHQQDVGERSALLHSLTTPEQAKRLCEQQREIPLIKDGLQRLRAQYEVSDVKGLDAKTRAKITRMHENLNLISEVLGGVAQTDKPFLQGVSLRDFNTPLLEKFLKGTKEMTPEDVSAFKNEVSSLVESQRNAPSQPVVDRPQFSESSIKEQIRLQKVIREGKAWMLEQGDIAEHGKSANTVRQVLDMDGNLIGYFKTGKDEDTSTAIMEHFMYDTAVVMGLERKFVPTGRMTLLTQADLAPKGDTTGPTIGVLSPDGTLTQVRLLTHALNKPKGSIQAAQTGQTLVQFLENGILDRDDVLESTVLQIGMGMFDAHGSNIIVGKELMYFDNASSFPQSNEPMLWGGSMLRFPMRSGLFQSPEMYEPLTPEDRKNLRKEVELWEHRYDALRAFVESPVSEKRLQALPPGWWDTGKILDAMKERITRMNDALNNPDVKNLRDFTLASYPNAKFLAALHMAVFFQETLRQGEVSDEDLMEMQQHSEGGLGRLGYDPIDALINTAAAHGVDVRNVWDECQEKDISFETLLNHQGEQLRGAKNLDSDEVSNILQNGTEMASNFAQNVVVEMKDMPRSACLDLQLVQAQQVVINLDLPCYFSEPERHTGLCFVSNSDTHEIYFRQAGLDGSIVTKPVNISRSLDGLVSIVDPEGDEVEVSFYCQRTAKEYPPYFHPFSDVGRAEEDLQTNSWLLRSPDLDEDADLMVSCNDDGAIQHNSVLRVGDGFMMFSPDLKYEKYPSLEALVDSLNQRGWTAVSNDLQ